VTFVALSADGRWVLSGGSDETLRMWELGSGRCVRTLQGGFAPVALSADGRWAVSRSWTRRLRLSETASGRCVRTFEALWNNSVALSPDDRWVLGGAPLRLWELATGRCVRTFEGELGVLVIAVNAFGRWAVSGDADRKLRHWELASGRCVRTLEGHTHFVNSVALSADGRWALSGSYDNTVRLWELATGRCVRIFEGHTGRVSAVALSDDGRWALSASEDNTLRRWFLDWELEDRQPADWDNGARPYLESFLCMHTPYAAELPPDGNPTEEQIQRALTRCGKPTWNDTDFHALLYTLGCAGYGWLRPEGVRRELEKMAESWQGPPPLE
jgi:WD40 repeat protein